MPRGLSSAKKQRLLSELHAPYNGLPNAFVVKEFIESKRQIQRRYNFGATIVYTKRLRGATRCVAGIKEPKVKL